MFLCVHAMLLAKAGTELLDVDDHLVLQKGAGFTAATEELIEQLGGIQRLGSILASKLAARPDAGEAAVSPPASLPHGILDSAARGELQNVAKWLNTGGLADALWSTTEVVGKTGQASTYGLLHAAATSGHLEVVKELLKRGASVDLQSSFGSTALMRAALYGHLSTLLLLLQQSSNPDLQDLRGRTALMHAAGKGQEACVQALLRAEANTELLDTNGDTALWHAEAKSHTATAELIRQHAARQPPVASPAAAPLASLPLEIYMSAQRGELQTVANWLNTGGLVDTLRPTVTRSDGRFLTLGLLHAAAEGGQLEMMRELLKHGASVDLQNNLGTTALTFAAFYGHTSILLLLLQHSANPDLQNVEGMTALMAAAGEGQEACIEALLRAEANIELLDKRGRTALHWVLGRIHSNSAVTKGHTATARRLRQHGCLSLGSEFRAYSIFGVTLCAVLPLSRVELCATMGVNGVALSILWAVLYAPRLQP